MGHLGKLKDEYRELIGRLDQGTVALPEPTDPGAWQGWREILEILYTPEEAALAARMPWRPTSLDTLSRRLGIPAAELEPRLDAMCDKGVVMDLVHPRTGKAAYLLSPPVVGFFEYSLMRSKDSIPKKRMAEALKAYTHGDEAFAHEALGRDTVIGRALVHETALSDDPLPDVLDWERATHVVGEARAWAVSLCYCRHKQEHLGEACDAPMDVCLTLNGGADFVARRGFGRSVERAEAMDILQASREKGLVQIADNVQDRPTFVCNCCGCCCEQLQAANRWGLRSVNGSGFAPRSDGERCSGCARRPADRKNALAPRFDLETCIGCGVCATACHKDALHMERGGERRPVPANPVEKAVRQALERNRLAELLFDGGEGLGNRFLRQATRAITSLPAAKQLLATEQVRSRFVKAAMARFKGG
jgi:hypothetical protein